MSEIKQDEDELFETLSGVDAVSIDPELALMLEIVAIAQRRLDDHPEMEDEILEDLNAQFPWIDKSVKITGEIFGPRRNQEGVIQTAAVHCDDEEVVAKGFQVIKQPVFVGGIQVMEKPTICYVFLVDIEPEELSADGLLTGKRFFHAVGYIDAVHVEPLEPSINHYVNIVREYALEYMIQVDAIVAECKTQAEMMMRLGEISIPPPNDATELEALQALIEYVYYVLKIDKNLPYAVKVAGTFYTSTGNAIVTDESEDDFEVDLEEQGVIKHVEDTEDKIMAIYGKVGSISVINIPTIVGSEVQASQDLHFAYEVDLYGKDQSRDFMQSLVVPARHITSIYAERKRHKRALV